MWGGQIIRGEMIKPLRYGGEEEKEKTGQSAPAERSGGAGGRQEDKSLSSAWRQITVNPPSVSLRHEINLLPTNWKDAIVLKVGEEGGCRCPGGGGGR